jgi:hypothetical protein
MVPQCLVGLVPQRTMESGHLTSSVSMDVVTDNGTEYIVLRLRCGYQLMYDFQFLTVRSMWPDSAVCWIRSYPNIAPWTGRDISLAHVTFKTPNPLQSDTRAKSVSYLNF